MSGEVPTNILCDTGNDTLADTPEISIEWFVSALDEDQSKQLCGILNTYLPLQK